MSDEQQQADKDIEEKISDYEETSGKELDEGQKQAIKNWHALIDDEGMITVMDAAAILSNAPLDPIKRQLDETAKQEQRLMEVRIESALKKSIPNPSAPANERRVKMGALLAWQSNRSNGDVLLAGCRGV